MLSYVRDNLKMKSIKKNIKNQKSLKQKKKTQSYKNRLLKEMKYLSVSNNTRTFELSGGDQLAEVKKQIINTLDINWWDQYLKKPRIDFKKIFDSVYYHSSMNTIEMIGKIKTELGIKYNLLMGIKNYIPEIEKNKEFMSAKNDSGLRNCELTYFFVYAEENQKKWREEQKSEKELPTETSGKRELFDIKEESFKKKFESGSTNSTHKGHRYFLQYYILRNAWESFYQLDSSSKIKSALFKPDTLENPFFSDAVKEITTVLKGKDLSLFPLKRFDKFWRLICLLSNNKLETKNIFSKIKKDIYNYQIFGDNPEKKRELDEFFKNLNMGIAKEKKKLIEEKKISILNETVEYHNNNLGVDLIVSLGVNYHVKEKKKEIENILNGTQSLGLSLITKLNDTIEEIMKTVKEKLPELKNPDGIKQKLIKFTEDIKGPSDILKKIKELPTLFNNDSPEKKGGYIKYNKNIGKRNRKKISLKNKKKYPKVNQIAGYPGSNSKTKETETSESTLSEDQKSKIIEIIKEKFRSLMTSMMSPKITEDVANHLKKLNPLDSLKGLFKQVKNVINGFRDSSSSNLGVQFSVADDFVIETQQKLEMCKFLKKHGVRVDHGLLNYIERSEGDIEGVIKDITYDYKIGQIKFNDSNVYWIPLELGKKKNSQGLSGGTKKNFQKKNSKNTLKNRHKKNFFGGYETMWQILLPIYDLENCQIPPESSGPKRSKPPPLNIRGKAGGGDPSSKKKFSFPKLRNPFAKKKEEIVVKDDFPGQKLKISGKSMRDKAKVAITVFISLIKSMEKNPHFKFIYYFSINSIYKFIKSIKEIIKYSKTANKNKKAARYLVYLGKLVCINTANLFNVDLLDYVNNKLNLALDFYELDALKNISELLKLGIQRIFDFNDQFCRYTSQLEMKLSSDNTSQKEEPNEQKEEGENEENQQTQSSESTKEETPEEDKVE